jgi:hypothetical protein
MDRIPQSCWPSRAWSEKLAVGKGPNIAIAHWPVNKHVHGAECTNSAMHMCQPSDDQAHTTGYEPCVADRTCRAVHCVANMCSVLSCVNT